MLNRFISGLISVSGGAAIALALSMTGFVPMTAQAS